MKAPLYSKEGKKKKEIELNSDIFEARVNDRLLQLVHNAYAANLRRGTANTKERAQVRGGGKKPWKQKGTGRARAGSSRSPIWRGGGTTFGPHSRSYFTPLSNTVKKKALISALALRARENNLMILEDVKLESAKTKEWAGVVKALPLENKRALCVVASLEDNLKLASKNMSKLVDVQSVSDFNAYDVLQRPKVVIAQDALEAIEGKVFYKKKRVSEKTAEEVAS